MCIRDRRKEAAYRRQHIQTNLRFNNMQMAAIRRAAQQMQADTADLWSKARPIIDQDHEWLKLNGRFAGQPPGHSQVHALQQQNEAAFLQVIAKLNHKLGPAATARLQVHLKSEIAPNVTIQRFPSGLAGDPRIDAKGLRTGHWEAHQ